MSMPLVMKIWFGTMIAVVVLFAVSTLIPMAISTGINAWKHVLCDIKGNKWAYLPDQCMTTQEYQNYLGF